MAQKTFPCTSCGQPIEVPEDFKAAVIDCPHCRAPHSRHSERPYVSPRAAKMAAPGTPLVAGNMSPMAAPQGPMPPMNPGAPPAYPAPAGAMPPPMPPHMPPAGAMAPGTPPYPGRPYMAPPPPSRGNAPLIIGLSIAGVLALAAAAVLLLPILATRGGGDESPEPALGQAPSTSAGEIPTEWVKYESKEGRFRAEFPKKPTVGVESFDSGIGVRNGTFALAEAGGIEFFVHFFDLGIDRPSEYHIDLSDAIEALPSATNTRILSTEAIQLGNNKGVVATFERNGLGYICKLARVRVGNRVFTIAADGQKRDAAAYWPRFVAAFNFDDELNFLESLYFEGPASLDLMTRQSFTTRLNGNGGKPPYTWSATGMPKGLIVKSRNDTSAEITGTLEEAGEFNASIVMADAFKREFKCVTRIKVVEAPKDAGPITTKVIKGRAGMPLTGRAVFKPVGSTHSVDWTWAEDAAPKGIKFAIYTPDLVVSGTPTQDGTFKVAISCRIKLKDSGIELESTGTLEFEILPAWPDVTARFGSSTLLIQHSGVYAPDPWKYLLTQLAAKCSALKADDKINLWNLTGFGRSVYTDSAAPQPKSAGGRIASLLNRDALKPKERECSAAADLAAIQPSDYQGYDKIILITNLVQDLTSIDKFKTELERLAAAGAAVDLVVIAETVAEDFKQWLATRKIELIHYVP